MILQVAIVFQTYLHVTFSDEHERGMLNLCVLP